MTVSSECQQRKFQKAIYIVNSIYQISP
uniref:Uncharacterized protein n=1 Tax=Arundo donax TaxID=35708 RepID=A0A0A9GWT5_ARUDO